MNRILILCCMLSPALFAQGTGGILMEESPVKKESVPSNSMPLENDNNTPAGNYVLEQRYKITFNNGTVIEVPALTNVLYAEMADRIITFGDNICIDMVHSINLNLYTSKGVFIKRLDTIIQQPFQLKLANDGSVIVFGYKKNKSAPGNVCYLIKYNKNGDLEWEHLVDAGAPNEIMLDANNQYIAITNSFNSNLKLSVFKNSNGHLIGSKDFIDKPYLEFFEKKLAVANNNQLMLFSLEKNKLENLGTSFYKGKLAGNFPLLFHPASKQLLLLTINNKILQLNGFSIEKNIESKISKSLDGYTLQNKPYKFFTLEGDKIKLITTTSELTFALKNE